MSPSIRPARARALRACAALAIGATTALGAALPAAAAGDISTFANPGDTITVDFSAQPEPHEWVVPAGVTSITIAIAAGSGASAPDSAGGAGGHLRAEVAVAEGETLLISVGAAGGTEPLMAGGQGSAVGVAGGSLIAVVGGGGAAYRCGAAGTTSELCAAGGAGGFSATAAGADGRAGDEGDVGLAGGPGTVSAPGSSADSTSGDTVVLAGVAPSATVASVMGDSLQLAPPTAPPADSQPQPGLLGGGGGGYTAGGHGGTALIVMPQQAVSQLVAGGGGGGSGYLVDGATVLELRDNAGDGFASISYVVPEPEPVPAPGPELALDSATVTAGNAITLSGTGFDPERAYPVILNSDPVLLGTVTTDVDGAFSASLTIPASVPAGEHVIAVGDASIPITVEAALVEEEAVVEDDADDAPLTRSAPPPPELAATGPEPVTASILGALALDLLAAGAALLRTARPVAARATR